MQLFGVSNFLTAIGKKSYIKCETCSSCNFDGRRMYCGTFIVNIYRRRDYHFKCGIDEFGQYFVENKKF